MIPNGALIHKVMSNVEYNALSGLLSHRVVGRCNAPRTVFMSPKFGSRIQSQIIPAADMETMNGRNESVVRRAPFVPLILERLSATKRSTMRSIGTLTTANRSVMLNDSQKYSRENRFEKFVNPMNCLVLSIRLTLHIALTKLSSNG